MKLTKEQSDEIKNQQAQNNQTKRVTVSELEKIEINTAATNRKLEKLSSKVDEISKVSDELSVELNLKREKIKENRDRVSSIRADLSLWTE